MHTGSRYCRIAFLLICFLSGLPAFPQKQNPERILNKIDSLASEGLPKSALAEVEKLDQFYRKTKNTSGQLKATFYRLTFLTYLEQEALLKVIQQLKEDISAASYPVKPVLQSVLAEMYLKYYQQNRYQFGKRSQLAEPSPDFTQWDLRTILQQISNLHLAALREKERLQKTPVSVLGEALEGDAATRRLRPTLYDLLVHRALAFYFDQEADLPKAVNSFSLHNPAYFFDSPSFAKANLPQPDTSANLYKGLTLLQEATRFHLAQNNQEALADLEIQRLKLLQEKASFPGFDTLYLSRLQEIAQQFTDSPLSADAYFLAGKFYQEKDSLAAALPFLEKALARFPESVGGRNAQVAKAEIIKKNIQIKLEDAVPSKEPILAQVTYKNLSTAHFTLYKITDEQLAHLLEQKQLLARYAHLDRSKEISREMVTFLKELPQHQQQIIQLPYPGDYRQHRTEFKLNGLPTGNYALLVQGGTTADTTLLELNTFLVTDLAYASRTNPDGQLELIVMHRKTGQPLPQVKVIAEEISWKSGVKQVLKIAEVLSDQEGKVTIQRTTGQYNLSFTLISDQDKYAEASQQYYWYTRSAKNDDDEENTILFTDRQIYRPGQTLYFKGIQVRKAKGKSELVTNEEIEVELYDANDKILGTLDLTTNKYGSFSGSFQIPASIVTGELTLETLDGEIEVSVEEYKRPSFQVAFSPIKEIYRLNDSVQAKGQVKAFSGYELSGAKVQYKIVRESVYSSDYPRKNRSRSYRTETLELASGTATTDVNGDFDITFKALAEVIPEYQGQQYVYEVTATVTDASGETQEEEVRVRVGQKVLDLELSLPSRILLPDSLNTVIWLTNLNQQLQAGSVTVEVFSLKSPGRLYKNRLWEEPDLSAFTTSEFEKVFPSYAPPGLSTYQNWPVKEKIYSQTLISTAQRPALLKAAFSSKVTPGLYLVQVTGVTQTGDTVSTRRHVSFVSDKNHQPVQMSDWVIPVKEKADVGEKAEFLVGAGNGTVLVEVYNGPELISSEWVNTGTNQMKMQVPIKPSFGNNVQVQFLMVKDNRLYKSQHKISQNRSEPTLALRFSTFRNKLVPGQKESWKLQITNLQNKAKAAEMVASLYDASLDKISRPQDWYSAFSQAISTYTPDYFSWGRGQFVSTVVSQSLQERPAFNPVFTREYERLHFFGYRYFGGYNHGYREFLKRVEQRKATEKADQALEETYKENAAQVKNGVEVAGQIIDNRSKEPLTGVTISLKGTNIVTFSNSKGYFKMRVPVPGKLEFNFIGYDAQVLSITKAGNVTIALEGDAQTLNEVVVVGYGVQERRELTGSVSTVTTIRGVSSLPDSNQLAGVAPGIKIDRTKATVSGKTAEVPITIRKNFQETAFFFPHLLTDAKGNITLEFTVPEALTRWQFKGFAHTRQLEWGLLEGQVMTQKQLMVSPYMPRFLREGDTLTVSARIANLSVDNLSGKVTLQFFNALTNQPIEILQNSATAEQDFKVAAASTTPVFFNLIVPGKVEALTYRITAQTKGHADGEENTLPVLPNSILVTETMPMLVRPGQTKSFTLEKLVQPKSTTLQSQTLTLEYIQNPVWSAVQALPYLMEYPYECAEQTFSRIYANSVAAHIVEKTPAIQKVFQLWKASTSQEVLSNLERNPGLKQTLLAETPWLKDAVSQTEQKKRIALLFDLNKMENELTANLEKLEGMQYGNGSFPWFVGMPPNRYITQHILAGIGQLEKLGVISASNSNFKAIKTKGVSYLNSVILEDKKYLASFVKNKSHLYPDQIHAWYARSYFTATPLSAELQNLWQTYQNLAAADWQYQSLYEQGLIALTMLRYGQSDLAQKIIKSLLERSQQSEELGLFWPQNRSGYFWYQAPVETQVLFIELFTEANADAKYLSEMKLWLLRHKQTNHWRTTKATAAACYALLLRGEDWLSAPAASAQITVGGTPLETLAPDLPQTAGSGYLKTSWAKAEIAPQLGNVQVKNTGSAPSWGALYWQYLEQTEKITASETQLKLKRQYFVQETTNARDILKPVSAANPPKVGDLVKVVIYLESDREFEYIHLKDLRPAGTEPVDALSGYQYQDGLYYYQSTTDASTNFFISRLGKGNYVFEYRLRVAHAGDFATGITTIQSMYAPEFNSHSEGGRITFGK